MAAVPLCRTPREVAHALDANEATLGATREEADARPLPYALGSGEADEVALYAGIKPLIRQVVPSAQVAKVRSRFEPLGLQVREATHRVALPSTEGTVLFIGRDALRVEEAVRCEAAPDHDLELGQLLGYPRCCVEAYLALPAPRSNVAAAASALGASRRCLARLNALDWSVFHYVSWSPCTFDCALAERYADAVASHIATKHGQFLSRGRVEPQRCPPGCRHERFVAAIDDALAAHRLLVTEDVQVSLTGKWGAGVVQLVRVWPTARDRHPDVALSNEAREAVARLVAVLRGARTLALHDSVLEVDGRPVLRAPDALLAPFGEG